MLKSLVENKVKNSFLVIEDKRDVISHDLFASALTNFIADNGISEISLLCYENSPEYYLSSSNSSSKKVTCYNYMKDPCGWINPSTEKSDLSTFTKNTNSLSERVFFIDSLSTLIHHHGYLVIYKNLNIIKKHAKTVICLVHGDLFTPGKLEELYYLATAWVVVKGYSGIKTNEKICEVTYKKPGGKIVKQNEIFSISENLKVCSRVAESKVSVVASNKTDIENLTTFKLGLQMSEEEKKARDELVLPYLKVKEESTGGQIIYQPDSDDWEDDPDDDLDI